LKILRVEAFFAMIENRSRKQGFATRRGAQKKRKRPKKTMDETEFFEIQRFERATRAKEKKGYICD